MNNETTRLVEVLRLMADDIERRGVVPGSVYARGEHEIIGTRDDGVYIRYRRGQGVKVSLGWKYADALPPGPGEWGEQYFCGRVRRKPPLP